MRLTTSLILQALAATTLATPIDIKLDARQSSPKDFKPEVGEARKKAGHIVVPGGLAPQKQDLTPRFTNYYAGSKRTKVRYGKYTLPKISTPSLTSLLTGEKGTMSAISVGMPKPCDTCNLLVAQAGLEYPDGTEADVTNGSWLHHIVVLATGPGRKDTVCPMIPGERFFSSGNERTPTSFGDVTNNKVKSCFPLQPADGFQAEIELMNMEDKTKDVYLTIDFEYIPGPKPSEWKTAKAMWLDVTNCGISYVTPPSKQNFQLTSRAWTSPYSGEMLGVGGHLHDGGTHLDIKVNNQVICQSDASYTTAMKPGEPMNMKRALMEGPHSSADGKPHIREMSTCTLMGHINKGDKVHIEANYEFSKFPGMKATEIMGIAIMYAAMDV